MLESEPLGFDRIFYLFVGGFALAKGIGDEGLTVEVMGGIERIVRRGFLRGEGRVDLTGSDLFGSGLSEAQLTGRQVDLAVVAGCAHGWPEGSAHDGAAFVEVAGSCCGVEDGAGLVVAKAIF